MFSVIIDTLDSERALLPTLAMLVAGATAGIVREVIIADGGSRDATTEVADTAGCTIMIAQDPLAARLRAAAGQARAPWLMFLKAGVVLDAYWIEDASRFVQHAEARGASEAPAAVFRRTQAAVVRPAVGEALALLRAAFGARARPEQGLVIPKILYQRLGGHRDGVADPHRDLMARLGRRRCVLLRSAAAMISD